MLKRIFKTILILNISIGISISTNAAVSVSDNSAFITKSEALAVAQSISERIIVLENTVDEKIDNLITAYLERNGVWTSQEQTIQNNDKTVGTSNRTVSSRKYVGEEILVTAMFLQTTTKSGVFSAEIRYKGVNYGGSLNLCRIGYNGSIYDEMLPYGQSAFDLTCNIYEDNTEDRLSHNTTNYMNYSDLRYTVLIGSAIAQRMVSNNTKNYIACMNLPVNTMIRPITFFVQKNSALWWNVISRCRFVNVNTATAVNSSNAGAQIQITLTDALIN